MRQATDPAWKRYYNACSQAHLMYGDNRITAHEMRRKIEAARRYAYATQVPR